MKPAPYRSAALVCTAAIGLAGGISGCGVNLESLPLAPSGTGNSYTVTAVFSNALNLPAKAKVKLNGADIGEVESITATDFTALVAMRIRTDVTLPEDTTAELRSATPLGDLFVAVRPASEQPEHPASLRDGGTIPLASTGGGATIEEVLSSAAMLVNGGVFGNLSAVLNGAGSTVGGHGIDVKAVLDQSTELISRLNARGRDIEAALHATSALAADISQRQSSLDTALAAASPASSVFADNTATVADLTDATARITRQLSRFPSLQGTDNRSIVADLNQLAATFNDITLDPGVSLNDINRVLPVAMKLTNSTSIHGIADVTRLALGSLPDKNYPGDPMFHGPDGTDWHAMIGSLRYEWNLLLDKIYGPER